LPVSRIEDLEETVVREIRDVEIALHILGQGAAACGGLGLDEFIARGALVETEVIAVHHGDDVIAIGRNLGHETDTHLAAELAAEVAPGNDVFVVDGHLLLDGYQSVESFVVGGSIKIEAESLAVFGEGMAVRAGGHVFQQDTTAVLVHVFQTPGHQGQRALGQGADDAFFLLGGHEGNIAIEDGCAHRIAGRADGDTAGADRGVVTCAESFKENVHWMLRRALFDFCPQTSLGAPGAQGCLFGCEFRQLVGRSDGAVVNVADFEPLALHRGLTLGATIKKA
jgi:hypothetical protein